MCKKAHYRQNDLVFKESCSEIIANTEEGNAVTFSIPMIISDKNILEDKIVHKLTLQKIENTASLSFSKP
jgi:hypothetical protein